MTRPLSFPLGTLSIPSSCLFDAVNPSKRVRAPLHGLHHATSLQVIDSGRIVQPVVRRPFMAWHRSSIHLQSIDAQISRYRVDCWHRFCNGLELLHLYLAERPHSCRPSFSHLSVSNPLHHVSHLPREPFPHLSHSTLGAERNSHKRSWPIQSARERLSAPSTRRCSSGLIMQSYSSPPHGCPKRRSDPISVSTRGRPRA